MRRLTSLLGGLTLVALLPAGSALLQGCLQCGNERTFDLADASGTYTLCPGGEHVFESSDDRSHDIQLEARRGLADVQVDFGQNRLKKVGDVLDGDNADLWYDEEYDVSVRSCGAPLDDAPLVVTTTRRIQYELLVEAVECGDE